MYIVWWIIVGLIAGWATGRIMRGSGYGPLMDIILGIVGAVIGGWIVSAVGFAGGAVVCLVACAGAARPDTVGERLLRRRGPRQGDKRRHLK